MNKWKGFFPALITPFDQRGAVNDKALADIVQLHLKQGAKGFYVTGSMAECYLLKLEERKHIVEVVRACTAGKALMIEHVGTPSTDISIELAEHGAKCGVDAISSTPPFYYKYSIEEICGFYRDIAQASDLPVVIYNIPVLVGVSLSPDDIAKIAENKNIIGVKYTDHNLYNLERMRRRNPRLVYYNGHDEATLPALALGADGAIGSTFNFLYPKILKLKNAFDSGNLSAALSTQEEINDIIALILRLGNLQSTKYLMNAYQIDCGECRLPMKRLSSDDKKELSQIFDRLN